MTQKTNGAGKPWSQAAKDELVALWENGSRISDIKIIMQDKFGIVCTERSLQYRAHMANAKRPPKAPDETFLISASAYARVLDRPPIVIDNGPCGRPMPRYPAPVGGFSMLRGRI